MHVAKEQLEACLALDQHAVSTMRYINWQPEVTLFSTRHQT
jgi:hypothetical protein